MIGDAFQHFSFLPSPTFLLEHTSHPRFADSNLVCTSNPKTLQVPKPVSVQRCPPVHILVVHIPPVHTLVQCDCIWSVQCPPSPTVSRTNSGQKQTQLVEVSSNDEEESLKPWRSCKLLLGGEGSVNNTLRCN